MERKENLTIREKVDYINSKAKNAAIYMVSKSQYYGNFGEIDPSLKGETSRQDLEIAYANLKMGNYFIVESEWGGVDPVLIIYTDGVKPQSIKNDDTWFIYTGRKGWKDYGVIDWTKGKKSNMRRYQKEIMVIHDNHDAVRRGYLSPYWDWQDVEEKERERA